MSDLNEHFSHLRDFLRTGFRVIVLICAIGFLAAGAAGYFIGLASPETVETVTLSFLNVAESSGVIQEDGNLSLIGLIANNWTAMLLSAAYGFLPFLFMPLTSLITNGFMLGIVGAMYQLYDQSLSLYLAGLLPHGIFELPALILSIACGIHLCFRISRSILGKQDDTSMVETLSDLLRVMLLLVAPMTLAAGLIEAYITPLIMAMFL